MNVTFRQLKVFESVARQLSYTRAAEELHLTQPAVSMQIKQLEDQVGLPLFEQLGKKIFLTEAGREMYHYSRAIAQQLEEAERVIAELKGVQRGRLSIAVASTANYFATRLLATFSQRYADVTISLDVTNREGLLRHLDDNADDLVIMGRPPQGLDLVAVLDVEAFPIIRHWYVVHRQGKRLSPVAQVFKAFVLNEGAKSARVPK